MKTIRTPGPAPRVRFDLREFAGAFGDIGTDLPLIVALIATCGLDAASVCIVFGSLQIATGLFYGIPMPVQPLKAMAAIMLTQRLTSGTLAGGGLVIGAAMLILAATGLLDWLARIVPKEVVRGVQLGLGITLASLALKDYASADGLKGHLLAAVSVVLLLVFHRQRKLPGPVAIIALGVVYAGATKLHGVSLGGLVGFRLPRFHAPTSHELLQGGLLLALPQIPLSLGNSVIATSQTTRDLFPARAVSARKIGLTYAAMNLVAPWFGGIPACHGCGGLVGFHGFGARSGGAPILYGSMYLVLGLFFAPGFMTVIHVFPMPVLGVVLLFESIALMTLVRDVASNRASLWLALFVAAAVVGLPYGYVVGVVAGTLIAVAARRQWVALPGLVEAETAPGDEASKAAVTNAPTP